jgi:hypothetical protein
MLGLLTAVEVADRFKVTRKWVYRHAEALGAVRVGGRALRFTEDGLARYLDAQRQRQAARPAEHPQPASASSRGTSLAASPAAPRTYRVSLSRRSSSSGKARSSRVTAPASDRRMTLA